MLDLCTVALCAAFVASSPGATLESGEVLGGQFVELRNTGAQTWTAPDFTLSGAPMSRATAVGAPTAPGELGRFDFSVTAPSVTSPATVHGAFAPSSTAGAWTGDAVGIDYTVLPTERPRVTFLPAQYSAGDSQVTIGVVATDNVAVAHVILGTGSQNAREVQPEADGKTYRATFPYVYCSGMSWRVIDRAGNENGGFVTPSCAAPPTVQNTAQPVAGSVVARWSTGRLGSRARSLYVTGAPKGGRIRVSCRGCGFKSRTVAVASAKTDLRPLLKHRRLRPGAVLEVRIVAPRRMTTVTRYTFRHRRAPTVSPLCLPPGARQPGACGRAEVGSCHACGS